MMYLGAGLPFGVDPVSDLACHRAVSGQVNSMRKCCCANPAFLCVCLAPIHNTRGAFRRWKRGVRVSALPESSGVCERR